MGFMARTFGRLFGISVAVATLALGITDVRAQMRVLDPAPPPAIADPSSTVAFEVASIKRAGPFRPGGMTFSPPSTGRYTQQRIPLLGLLINAYGIRPYQIVGGPPWMTTDVFEVNAKAEEGFTLGPNEPGVPNKLQTMLQALLRERFALKVHRETRELPIAELVMARKDGRLGERLKRSTVDCLALAAERRRTGAAPPAPPDFGAELPPCTARGGIGMVSARAQSLAMLLNLLAGQLNRPVYDRTNLTGAFDYDMQYTPDNMPAIPAGTTLPPGLILPSPDGPSLMTAIQEQLGLKIEMGKGPVDVLVIDAAEPPTPD